MKHDPHKHHRRSIRLKEYDYSQPGGYFVTICTHGKEQLFGRIVDGELKLNMAGREIENYWRDIPKRFPSVEIDEFVIMPNHVHGIVFIIGDDRIKQSTPFVVGAIHELPLQRRQMLLAKVIGRFKMTAAKRINELRGMNGCPVWQRNYYEHIIRGEKDLNAIRKYIVNNPARWGEDEENMNLERSVKRKFGKGGV